MQEYGISVVDALKQGLPPDPRAEARGDFVSKLVNVRPTRFGAEGLDHLRMPPGLYGKNDWPLPQFFYGRKHTFVCTRDSILVVERGNEQKMTRVKPIKVRPWNARPIAGLSNIVEGGRWQFVDMGQSFYFYNGRCVVFQLFDEFDPTEPKAFINGDVPINCGARFKGRNAFAGLDGDLFRNFNQLTDEVQDSRDEWSDKLPLQVRADDFSGNTVMWSSIGGGDFPAWLFWPKVLGRLAPSWDEVRKKFKRNQLGWLHLPVRGEVKVLKPLGDTALIAFSENGVFALVPTTGGGQDVPATFGVRQLSGVGIKDRGAAISSPDGVLYVGDNGRLRAITGQLQTQTLGYEQFLKDLTDTVVEYNPREEEYYISGVETAYCFGSDNSFYEHGRSVSSMQTIEGQTFASVQDTGHSSADIETSFIDFGQTGRKTVTQVDVDYRGPYQPYVSVAFKYNSGDPLQTTEWQQTGPDGTAPIRVDGTEFKVKVYFPSYEDLEIDDVKVRFQLPDKRFIRGARANTANNGTS